MFFASALFAFAVFVWAEERPSVSNIGFMENPPKELKEKFPMCDAFLKVEWIDKEKKIGYSHYEAVIEEKKKSVWALVNLGNLMPSYTLDVYQYKRGNKMNELFELVKNGKPGRVYDLFVIDHKGGRAAFYENLIDPLLSNNQQTVCIAYPDEQRAWIIEGKSAEHAFSESQELELIAKLNEMKLPYYTPEYAAALNRKSFGSLTQEIVDPLWVLDVNHDSKSDLVRISFGKDLVIYSSGDRYYQMAVKDNQDGYIAWSFPPGQRICELKPYGHGSFMTTDGKNFFLNNGCNLTQLTSTFEKE